MLSRHFTNAAPEPQNFAQGFGQLAGSAFGAAAGSFARETFGRGALHVIYLWNVEIFIKFVYDLKLKAADSVDQVLEDKALEDKALEDKALEDKALEDRALAVKVLAVKELVDRALAVQALDILEATVDTVATVAEAMEEADSIASDVATTDHNIDWLILFRLFYSP